MLDLAVRGGHVVDGTGAPRRRADVGVAGGRVVVGRATLGEARRDRRRRRPGRGPRVRRRAHPHRRPGVLGPDLSPSPLHGVTTVIAGNCGFTLAPVDDPRTPTTWCACWRGWRACRWRRCSQACRGTGARTAEYLDRLEGTPGHQRRLHGRPLARCAASSWAPTPPGATPPRTRSRAMAALLHDGLAAGGLGFSSSWGSAHNDADGVPVPSRHADRGGAVALAAVCGELRRHLAGVHPAAGERPSTSDQRAHGRHVGRRPSGPSTGTCSGHRRHRGAGWAPGGRRLRPAPTAATSWRWSCRHRVAGPLQLRHRLRARRPARLGRGAGPARPSGSRPCCADPACAPAWAPGAGRPAGAAGRDRQFERARASASLAPETAG